MGRFAGLGGILVIGGVPTYFPQDLFRFASPGVHSYSSSFTEPYFSIDNGTSARNYFNPNPSGDFGDWEFVAPLVIDSFDAFASLGAELNFTNGGGGSDGIMMNVLGYDTGAPAAATQFQALPGS